LGGDIAFQTASSNAANSIISNWNTVIMKNNGNFGINTDDPIQKLHVVGNTYLNGNLGIGISTPAQKLHVVGTTYLNGNVGIGVSTPQAKLDVSGDVSIEGTFALNKGASTCLAIGSAFYSTLNWGTSYIGFNAIRNNSARNWTCTGDGVHNGGGLIYTTVDGSIYFASIPSTGGSNKTLTDAQIKQNIKLHLNAEGKLKAKQLSVSLAGWPDFVFESDYNLPALTEVEQYIKQYKRLPNIPAAQEIEENGLDVGDMQSKLLQKIEELTLYILQQHQQIADLQNQINELKNNKP
jgi:hypothetical protein